MAFKMTWMLLNPQNMSVSFVYKLVNLAVVTTMTLKPTVKLLASIARFFQYVVHILKLVTEFIIYSVKFEIQCQWQ